MSKTILTLAIYLTVNTALIAAAHAERRTLFTFGAPQGAVPSALTRSRDNRVYGVTREGGDRGNGVLYTVDDNNHPSVLYSFTGDTDGLAPYALVSATDGSLYGLSEGLSWPPNSQLFRRDRSGSLRILRTWDVSQGAVLLVESSRGGVIAATAAGGVYMVDASGSQRSLYSFSNGEHATTLVAGPDGQLYGTTTTQSGSASLFRLSSSGQLTRLASFAAATENSGAEEPSALARTPSGSLYVATSIDGRGAIYRWRGDGPLIHLADLEQAPATLHSGLTGEVYGTLMSGGTSDGGSIFRLSGDGRIVSLHDFTGADGAVPVQLASSASGLYGISSGGGAGFGTLFRMRGGSDFATLHTFQYPDGTSPSDLVRASDGTLYGTTLTGGPNNAGTVFTLNRAGQLRTLYAFNGADGARPTSLMQASDGNLYGRTSAGAKRGFGSWFRISAAGELTTLFLFDAARQGEGPAVVQAASDTFFAADRADSGHIVKLGAAGGRSVVYTFPDGASRDGFGPNAIVLLNGMLYGTTEGASGPLLPPYLSAGTIFKLSADGVLTTLYAFKEQPPLARSAATPRTMILGKDGQLYGITPNFAFSCPSGTLWRFDPTTSSIQLLHAFTGKADGADPAALTELRPGVLYGMTLGGQGVPQGSDSNACEPDARQATLFRYASGRFTTVDTLPFAISSNYSGPPRLAAVKLVAAPDGKLYGAIANGARGMRSELFVYTGLSPND